MEPAWFQFPKSIQIFYNLLRISEVKRVLEEVDLHECGSTSWLWKCWKCTRRQDQQHGLLTVKGFWKFWICWKAEQGLRTVGGGGGRLRLCAWTESSLWSSCKLQPCTDQLKIFNLHSLAFSHSLLKKEIRKSRKLVKSMLVSSNAAYLGLCSKVDTYTFVSLYTVTPQPKCSTMAAIS